MTILEEALREKRTTLTEHASKQLLKTYGIPVTREIEAGDRETFLGAIREIGFPLVLKGSSPGLSHKTEQGMVRVDIRHEEEALETWSWMMERLKGEKGAVLVQEMVQGKRELVVGLTRDAQFGPCVMFGLGGIFTEILRDVSFRVAPLQKRDALEMMEEIKGKKILESVRGMPEANRDRLADILVKVGEIGLAEEAIKEIDINPLILRDGEPVAVDALVVLAP